MRLLIINRHIKIFGRFDFAKENEINLPKLKLQANKPARFREGDSTIVVFSTTVEKYQSLFFQTLNITMEKIKLVLVKIL